MIDITDIFYGVGVDSVEVDGKKNMATVKGTIDSREIIKKLEDWGKKAVLVHERRDPNPIKVEEIDDDEEEKDLPNDSFRHKDSSFRHKDFSFRHRNSSDRHNDSAFSARDRGSSHAPEKYERSEKNSAKKIPDHICTDEYCTYHRRDNTMPNMNYGASYSPMFRGGHNYNYPMMNAYPPPPYGPPPPPPPYGQYYGPEVMPPEAAYSHFSNRHRNGCNIM